MLFIIAMQHKKRSDKGKMPGIIKVELLGSLIEIENGDELRPD